MQIEAARGEILVRSSVIGTEKLSEGIALTIVPEPNAGTPQGKDPETTMV